MTVAHPNAEQAAEWNGEQAAHWVGNADRYDAMAGGFTEHLFTAATISEDERVLDIGCGTGHTTRIAARHATRGHATGIDLSGPMLDLARQRAAEEDLPNVTFVLGDAQLHRFPAGTFDVAISRAGVMFFADPVAAFRNIRRALDDHGRLVFVCHRELSNSPVLAALSAADVAPNPAAFAPGVLAFTDPGQVHEILTAAGFQPQAPVPFEFTSPIPGSARDAAEFLLNGSLRALVRDADAAAHSRACSALATALRLFADTGTVRLPAAGWLHTARMT